MATEVKRGNYAAYLSAGTTTVFTGPGRLHKVTITAASSTADICYDNTSASGNIMLQTPATSVIGTVYDLDTPFDTGLTVTVGTGGEVCVTYSQHK